MSDDGQIEFANVGVVTPAVAGALSALGFARAPRCTREKGRHYERSKVCPTCFKPFTSKGIARHMRACRRKQNLTGSAPRA